VQPLSPGSLALAALSLKGGEVHASHL